MRWLLASFILFLALCVGFALTFFRQHEISPTAILPVSSQRVPSYVPQMITVDAIFSENHSWTQSIPKDKIWTLVATGDIIPARSVNFQSVKRNDFTWAFKNIAPILKSGDITLINLESPLVPKCVATVEGMTFCGDQRHVEGLLFAGVDVANFANNHMGNYGVEGIAQTRKLLEDNSIHVSGLGEAYIQEIQGIRVAFLGFDDIGPLVVPISGASKDAMQKQITDVRSKADVVIVSMNWGVEYTSKPTAYQQELAHLAIDSGADLIIGNHPHWVQGVELYKGKLITYAHGNTIFDQMWSEETKKGVIGTYTFYGKTLVDVSYTPIYIKDYGQPMILEGESRKIILDQMKKNSSK